MLTGTLGIRDRNGARRRAPYVGRGGLDVINSSALPLHCFAGVRRCGMREWDIGCNPVHPGASLILGLLQLCRPVFVHPWGRVSRMILVVVYGRRGRLLVLFVS